MRSSDCERVGKASREWMTRPECSTRMVYGGEFRPNTCDLGAIKLVKPTPWSNRSRKRAKSRAHEIFRTPFQTRQSSRGCWQRLAQRNDRVKPTRHPHSWQKQTKLVDVGNCRKVPDDWGWCRHGRSKGDGSHFHSN